VPAAFDPPELVEPPELDPLAPALPAFPPVSSFVEGVDLSLEHAKSVAASSAPPTSGRPE
jgi:hypothetical protein